MCNQTIISQLPKQTRAFLGFANKEVKVNKKSSVSLATMYMNGATYEQLQVEFNLTPQALKKELKELFKKGLIQKRDKRKPACSLDIKVEAAAMMIAGDSYKDAQIFIKDKTGIEYALATIKEWKNAPNVQDELKKITQ